MDGSFPTNTSNHTQKHPKLGIYLGGGLFPKISYEIWWKKNITENSHHLDFYTPQKNKLKLPPPLTEG